MRLYYTWTASTITIITKCTEDLELISSTEHSPTINNNKENNNQHLEKKDQIASDYVIHEQPIQSTLLQKRTEDNLELLKTKGHNQTINNKE